MTRILIAGGGTGGHVFPMVAVAEALRGEDPSAEVVLVGTPRGIEARVARERGERLLMLDILPLRGAGLRGLLRGAVRAVAALPRARALVASIAPDVVFSVGGYAAGPVSLAAWSLAVPVALLEPNAVWGVTNRLLLPFAARVYGGFPQTLAHRSLRNRNKAVWTGVPLRGRFEPSSYRPGQGVRILVMGGSQGARWLNETVPRAIASLPGKTAVNVVHQAGEAKLDAAVSLYRELGVPASVVPFIDDVPSAIAAADVVIERAGAGSLAELCAVGRASILVPYPFAADDHQLHNAAALASEQAAICVPQRHAGAELLCAELSRLTEDAALRERIAENARRLGRPDAARAIARDLLAIAQKKTLALSEMKPVESSS